MLRNCIVTMMESLATLILNEVLSLNAQELVLYFLVVVVLGDPQ